MSPTHTSFLLVDEEVVASVLEGSSKGNTPFVYAVSPMYGTNEYRANDPEEPFQGHLKVRVEEFLTGFLFNTSDGDVGFEEIGLSTYEGIVTYI
jgi:hypothetical protein